MEGAVTATSPREWPGPDPFPEVLARAKRGDEAAFVALWRWLHPPLLGWLRATDPAHADDAAAEAWVSVTRSLAGFDGDAAGFRSWVFTIARRRSVDEVRAAARRPAPGGLGDLDRPGCGADDPAAVVAERSGSEAALALLHQLPAAQAEVLALRVVAGLGVAEVAAVVGRSEGAVRVLAHRGVHRLRELLPASPVPADLATGEV